MTQKPLFVSIGLEVHVQLATESKLFCSDSTQFGAAQNTQVSEVSLAYPGTLPVLNEKACRLALRMAIAAQSEIPQISTFDRKNYFYPDLPKGYQITQDKNPIAKGGFLTVDGRMIPLTKIHLEEDAGKSIHSEDDDFSLIDYNRAGVPLIEIVTEPDIHSAEEASKFLALVRKTVRYLGISDGNMEEGSLRCDVNISLSSNDTLGKKVEVKNLNSIKNVQRAIGYEIKRQTEILRKGKDIKSETRLFNLEKGITSGMREKETLNDYRYFPDPDLPSFEITSDILKEVRKEMFYTPWQLEELLQQKYDLGDYEIGVISEDPKFVQYFLKSASHCTNYKALTNWLMGPVKAYLNEKSVAITEYPIGPDVIAELVNLVESGEVTIHNAQKLIYPQILDNPAVGLQEIVNDLSQEVNNQDELSLVIREVIRDFPKEYELLKSGKSKLMGMFMGEIMKRTKGKADPKKSRELLMKNIS